MVARLGELYLPPSDTRFEYFLYANPQDKADLFPCHGSSPTVLTGVGGRYEVHHFRLSVHELVHLYTLREPHLGWSQLLTEGLAVYLGDYYAAQHPETPASELTDRMPAEAFLAALPQERQVSLAQLHAWPTNAELSEDERSIRYLTAGAFTRYLFEARDPALVLDYLEQHQVPWSQLRSQALLDALAETYSTDIDSLERDFRRWMASQATSPDAG
ncbi:hypothetical protein JY651_13660 [Pyxidicoccus parkwayensis]|uniref:Peptidase MA-like domain-containing protein n=1 Tax=Pyxidicoccus parkwayensis TaxID=2813578 RepID=A0ABX7P640_9BACT|nr:hypothetical protein [Pyxidicoccus parkwaysis]QSQ25906.1 hypothetical protein JY651_13660 [Pyxidicoccus parkwaysis]